MHFIIFIVLFIILSLTIFWTVKKALLIGKWEYIIYFLLLYFPIYTVFLSVTYASTESVVLVKAFQFFKDLIVIFAVFIFVLFQNNIFKYPFRLTIVDKLFLMLTLLAVFFLFAPVGEATFSAKVFYFKGMLIPALVYFLGRNTNFDDREVGLFFKIIFGIVIVGFGVNVFEVIFDIHFQNITGYAGFNLALNNVEPTGNFGLSWTFETQAITKRLASIYSDPLELSSSVLMGFAVGLIFYLTSKRENANFYLLIMIFSFISLILASSRASFASFFVMLFFIAVTFRLYTLIMIGVSLVLAFIVFVVFIATEDFYYFVIDTLTFQNLSSVGHLVEWLVALEGMIANPFGVGLAMSGNAGSVTDELRIGGENQFLIYGVQLGWLGMITYILLLSYAIIHSIKVFRSTENLMTARIAFTGAAAKTALILPLFTANAEMYLYVSWISWWMVGYAMNNYPRIQHHEA
ncbi:O-antigen ligase domain-containing protein [Belliella sp. DSM 107340]|uniref:O-antigen ligase domain-containing protein n=1 Tax=Belliella calami TaxID=2923436 RepID=A0ABS9UM77_9BACT|nr:O-antigen ligase domain-containing protein [Belliella calami]MCH7397726.1 O-antigen ligase domain-containing protein [Belliella calami]